MGKYEENIFKKLRRDILKMSYQCKAGHIPSALSMVDYFYVLLKEKYINYGLDKIIIGKPYGAQAYYAVLADLGIIDPSNLGSFGKEGSPLTYGITSKFDGITFAEDTLGSCLGVACGLALSIKNKMENRTVYVNVSDASLQAGTIWEAVMFASSKNLNNILMTVDFNKQQVLGNTFGMENIADKFKSFGWGVIHTGGHDYGTIKNSFDTYKKSTKNKPYVIIFDTIKGKGVSFMENDKTWHYQAMGDLEYTLACKENED